MTLCITIVKCLWCLSFCFNSGRWAIFSFDWLVRKQGSWGNNFNFPPWWKVKRIEVLLATRARLHSRLSYSRRDIKEIWMNCAAMESAVQIILFTFFGCSELQLIVAVSFTSTINCSDGRSSSYLVLSSLLWSSVQATNNGMCQIEAVRFESMKWSKQ